MLDSSTLPARGHRQVWGWVAFGLFLVLALWYWWPDGSAPPAGRGFRGMAGQATPVSVVSAQPGQVDRTLQALGTVTSPPLVTIRARVDGPLQALQFRDGEVVNAGDVLAVIDPRPFQIQLQQAQGQQLQHAAQLENARLDLARYERLYKQDSVARQLLDSARAQVRELEGQARIDAAAVADARLQLSYTEIRAPVSGRLGLRQVDVGNMIRASDAEGLVVLTQDRPIDVLFSVAQVHLPDLLNARRETPDLPVQLRAFADGPVLASGVLIAVDNQIDVATGTVRLKARFDNADESLFPNQFVQVYLRLGLASGLVLPVRAVQRGSAGEYVYRVDAQNKAHVVPVLTGVDDGSRVVVETGLQAGDTVVLEGTDRLRDGSAVEIIPAEAPGAGADAPVIRGSAKAAPVKGAGPAAGRAPTKTAPRPAGDAPAAGKPAS